MVMQQNNYRKMRRFSFSVLPIVVLLFWTKVQLSWVTRYDVSVSYMKNGKCNHKRWAMEILHEAGFPIQNITQEVCETLPTHNQVLAQYGDSPVILGLESCSMYRETIAAYNSSPAVRITGLYNTGTNAMAIALMRNLVDNVTAVNHTKADSYYQVPWTKHMPANYRTVRAEAPDLYMPIILIRDPFRWMASMCKSNYLAIWKRAPRHCPNLVPSAAEKQRPRYKNVETYTVSVRYSENVTVEYPTLLDMWIEWNREYVIANFPHIIIRFEDTLIHAEEVMKAIGDCVGLSVENPYRYLLQASKDHGRSSNFLTALTKFADAERFKGMVQEDLDYATSIMDHDIMRKLHYHGVMYNSQH